MVHLRRHATDRPGRGKEPPPPAATDPTAQRARQGRGRPIRRRVSGECAARCRTAGSLIPHARAIRALVIAMIEAPFGAASMAVPRGGDRPPTPGTATGQRAVGVPAIARDTDREEAVTKSTGFLAKRRVHGAGAAGCSSWTSSANRGTRERTASACRSPRQSRGPGGSVRVLTSVFLSLRDHRHTTRAKRAWTVARLWTHRTRPQVAWKTRTERGFPTPPTPRTSLRKKKDKDQRQERPDEHCPDLRDLR